MKNKNCLNLLSLNVCGIRNRILYPEFKSLLSNYDIVCFTETKVDDLDIVEYNDYIFHFKNRKRLANYKSGGMALGYRKGLEKFIKPLETNCKFVFWFCVDKNL